MFQASLQLRRHQKSRGWGTGQTPESSPKKKSPREKNRLAGRPKTRDSECPQGSPRRRPQPSSQSRLFGPCLYLNSVLCCLGCQCQKARWLGNTHEILSSQVQKTQEQARRNAHSLGRPARFGHRRRSDRNMREAGKSPFISVAATPQSFTATP